MENGHGNTREIIHTWLTVHGYVELRRDLEGIALCFFFLIYNIQVWGFLKPTVAGAMR